MPTKRHCLVTLLVLSGGCTPQARVGSNELAQTVAVAVDAGPPAPKVLCCTPDEVTEGSSLLIREDHCPPGYTAHDVGGPGCRIDSRDEYACCCNLGMKVVNWLTISQCLAASGEVLDARNASCKSGDGAMEYLCCLIDGPGTYTMVWTNRRFCAFRGGKNAHRDEEKCHLDPPPPPPPPPPAPNPDPPPDDET
jgi:hypothetical protein